MECDMCGKTATVIAEIEGARLNACANCAKHGKLIRQIPVAEKKSKSSEPKAPVRRERVEQIVEEIRKDFPKVLRAEREKRNLTQEDFAKILQIKLSTYHHFESGLMAPDLELARKLEHALKIPFITTQKQESWSKPEDKINPDENREMMVSDFIKIKKK